MLELLLAPEGATEVPAALARLRRAARLRPFSEPATAFAAALAGRLLGDRALRALPDLVAFGYWIRRARLEELARRFERGLDGDLALARGLVLHYAPSNVDTVFAYSWLLALLTGNANVVRVSRRRERTAQVLLDHVAALLGEGAHGALRERTLVVSFDHDPELNRVLSAACELRVIWGGDETIRRIREAPLPPSATDLVFPDRFSLAAFRAEALLALDEAGWERFVEDFGNDVFTYGQMACSSPRHIAWVGAPEARERAQREFWPRLRVLARARDEQDWAQPASARLTAACRFALLEGSASVELEFEPPVTRLEARELAPEAREIHPGGGFFVETQHAALAELAAQLVAKDQTLVTHGFGREELAAFAAGLPAGGADRIVAAGRALQFSHVWDGQDLLQSFTRRIVLSV